MSNDALLLTPEQAARRLNVARSFLYARLLGPNVLPSVKIGKCRRIPAWALEAYVAQLAQEQGVQMPARQTA